MIIGIILGIVLTIIVCFAANMLWGAFLLWLNERIYSVVNKMYIANQVHEMYIDYLKRFNEKNN